MPKAFPRLNVMQRKILHSSLAGAALSPGHSNL